ncbi:MAG: hypothetical protein GY765_26790 [bacterium]|nr:hypothetical protein [bacterium]
MPARKFEEQVIKTPGNIAVKTTEESFTYRELNLYANSIALQIADDLEGKNQFPHLRCILLGGEPVRQHEVDLFKSNFPKAVPANVYGLDITCNYFKGLFQPATVVRFMVIFKRVLENIAADPGEKVPQEQRQEFAQAALTVAHRQDHCRFVLLPPSVLTAMRCRPSASGGPKGGAPWNPNASDLYRHSMAVTTLAVGEEER